MNKIKTYIFLVLIVFSCQKNSESNKKFDLKIIEDDFKGQTYELIGNKYLQDTLNIQFRDSTFHSFIHDHHMPKWRVSEFEDSFFLILDMKVLALKRISEGNYKGKSFVFGDVDFILKKMPIKYKKEMIYGIWVEEKWVDTKVSDFPPLPNSLMDSITSWPPSYEITSDSIISNQYKKTKSQIEINNTNEFLSMRLRNPVNLTYVSVWKIKSINDSVMIIDRYKQKYFDSNYEWEHNIKLIKNR